MQKARMIFCPVSGERDPTPDIADAWRWEHQLVWLFNPWTGCQRERMEIERDQEGRMLCPPGDDSVGPFLPDYVKMTGAIWTIGKLEVAGWTIDLNYGEATVTASKRGLTLTFNLYDPMDEERYYTLMHSEASGSCLRGY
ncbi:hypothetical protein GO300_03823 [Ralstonia solanacearum]|nr:hypothetical protein [Ralstonia solanacearum]